MIDNAKNNKLSDLSSGLPDVGSAVMGILQPVVASYIIKEQEAGYTQERIINLATKVSIQPLESESLKIMPEGQRSWRYYTIYALSNLDIPVDNSFCINSQKFRILSRHSWIQFGYIEYEVVQDYDLTAPDSTEGTGYATS